MKISNLEAYIVHKNIAVEDALQKIDQNQSKVIFVLDDLGVLYGSLSDGDFRRWLIKGNTYNKSTPIIDIINKNVKFVNINTVENLNSDAFKDGIKIIPVVDDLKRIQYLVTKTKESLFIKDYEISETSKPFVIAEIGNNHQGSLKTAKKLIDVAAKAGADCVKFQMRSMSELYGPSPENNKNSWDLGSQYTLDLLKKFQLSDNELIEAFDYSQTKGLIPLCTPWDTKSLQKLENYGMVAYKVASADLTNFELLQHLISTRKPFFCSTGMSTELEIEQTTNYLNKHKADFVLLHCSSTYPTPFKDVNLNYLFKLKQISGGVVGYSGHERGFHIPLAACALGAKVIEKHITLDKEQEGTDHSVSLLPEELNQMVQLIKDIHVSLGNKDYSRQITQGEMMNRQILAKSIFTRQKIFKGDFIKRSDLVIKGPGKGIQPNLLEKVIGIKANRNIPIDTPIYNSDLTEQIQKKYRYKINRPQGIPVRYHDFNSLTSNIKLDFVEFHLSYSDLTLSPEKFITGEYDYNFSVHCPELFENDHLLDLTAKDKSYIDNSIKYINEVIDICIVLKKLFPMTKKPTLIVNVGGWNKKGFITKEEKDDKYFTLRQSLKRINLDEVNFTIQTMPPFPWHFGGQSHHNLFVCADEINRYCKNDPRVSICLDTSHSMMASKYYGWDFYDFIKKISDHVSYLHLADSTGIDGEGVDFGHGEINFYKLIKILDTTLVNIPFIPEVWQGHLNEGEGFWKALHFLENLDVN